MNKPNIALVMGGYSGEHDISIQSGCQVYEVLDHQKYNVYKIVIDRQGWYCLADNDQIYLFKWEHLNGVFNIADDFLPSKANQTL